MKRPLVGWWREFLIGCRIDNDNTVRIANHCLSWRLQGAAQSINIMSAFTFYHEGCQQSSMLRLQRATFKKADENGIVDLGVVVKGINSL